MKKCLTKRLKMALDVIIKSEKNDRFSGILYQPAKPDSLVKEMHDKTKTN